MKLKIVKISLYYPPFNSFCNIVIITVKGIFDPQPALTCFISTFKIPVRPFLKQKRHCVLDGQRVEVNIPPVS